MLESLRGYEFFSDNSKAPDYEFYLVNFQEKTYIKIATKGQQFYELCMHLYCVPWKYAECNYGVLSTCKEVFSLDELSGII